MAIYKLTRFLAILMNYLCLKQQTSTIYYSNSILSKWIICPYVIWISQNIRENLLWKIGLFVNETETLCGKGIVFFFTLSIYTFFYSFKFLCLLNFLFSHSHLCYNVHWLCLCFYSDFTSPLTSPDRILNIVTVERDEKSEDGEEHDGDGRQHKATGASGDL